MPLDPVQPAVSSQNGFRYAVEILIIISFALIAAFVAFYVYLRYKTPPLVTALPVPEQMVNAVRSGEFESVIQENNRIQTKSVNPTEKAIASLNTYSSDFRLTADVQSRIKDIQQMKKVVLDPNVAQRIRVTTLDTLSTQYCNSGRDPQIFAELYKEEPFSKLKTDDPDLSARLMAEWAYSIRPTSFNSIRIAHWYSKQWMMHPNMPATTTAAYKGITIQYLKKAEEVSQIELGRDKDFQNSLRYIGYRFWRTVIISRLARIGVEPYSTTYRAEYDNFIKFAQSQDNVFAKDYLFFTRLFFSQHLTTEKDARAAEAQLNQLAQDLDMLANPNTSSFVRYLRHESKYYPTEFPWVQVKKVLPISATFNASVEHLLETAPDDTVSYYNEDSLPI